MKKVLSLLLAATFALSLAACSSDSSDSTSSTSASDVASTEEATSNSSIEVEKKLLTVDITLPASMFTSNSEEAVSGEETTEDEVESGETAEEYCDRIVKEDGYLKATPNADGSVTLTMTKAKHDEMMTELKQSIDESIQNSMGDDGFKSIKEVTYNNDATEFTVKVDREAFEGSWDGFSALTYAFTGEAYQYYNGVADPRVEVTYVDVDTGDTIDTSVYPDDFQNMLGDGDSENETEAPADSN